VAVTFAVPMDESVEQLPTLAPGVIVEEPETLLDSFDIVDERTSLLRAEGGIVSQMVGRDRSTGDISGAYHTPEVEITADDSAADAGVDSHAAYDASNLSLASSSSSDDDVEWVDAAEDRALTATSQSQSAPSTPHQKSSIAPRQSTEAVAPPAPAPTLVPLAVSTTTAGDMYHWMKRQQDFTTSRLRVQQQGQGGTASGLRSRPPSETQVSWPPTGLGDMSRDDSIDIGRQRYVTHSAFQLADAQVQFQLLVLVLLFEFTPVAEFFVPVRYKV